MRNEAVLKQSYNGEPKINENIEEISKEQLDFVSSLRNIVIVSCRQESKFTNVQIRWLIKVLFARLELLLIICQLTKNAASVFLRHLHKPE